MSYKYEGSKYRSTREMNFADVAKMVREELKKEFSSCVFSVTMQRYSGGRSLHISLMSSPFVAFNDDAKYMQCNQYSLLEGYERHQEKTALSKDVFQIMENVVRITEAYNFDDSDSQSDYFHVNFYTHYNVGKWDKPYTVKEAKKQTEKTSVPVVVGGVVVRKNEEKNGIEVVFPSKPDASILELLKNNGFRWSRFAGLWWSKYNEEKFNLAMSIVGGAL